MRYFDWFINVCKLYLAALIIWATNSALKSEQNHFYSCDICAREIWNKGCKWVIPWHSARTLPWRFLLAKCHVTHINVFYFTLVRKVRPSLHRFSQKSPMLISTCALWVSSKIWKIRREFFLRRGVSLHESIQTNFGATQPKDDGESFPRGKAVGTWRWPLRLYLMPNLRMRGVLLSLHNTSCRCASLIFMADKYIAVFW
jgi:hypothetical protein